MNRTRRVIDHVDLQLVQYWHADVAIASSPGCLADQRVVLVNFHVEGEVEQAETVHLLDLNRINGERDWCHWLRL